MGKSGKEKALKQKALAEECFMSARELDLPENKAELDALMAEADKRKEEFYRKKEEKENKKSDIGLKV